MKLSEFNKTNRKITIYNHEGETFEFTSYPEMLGMFDDLKTIETWAKAHTNVVFVCHRFDIIGKIVETFETDAEAEEYAEQLNEFFMIIEEYDVIEEDDNI